MKRRVYKVVRVNPVEDDRPVHKVVRVNPHIQAHSVTALLQQSVARELNNAGELRPSTRFREPKDGGLHVTGIDPYAIVKNKELLTNLRRTANNFGLELTPGAGAILFSRPYVGGSMARHNPTDLQVRERFDRCVADVSARGGTYSPQAVCAASMRKAYGDQFQKIAAEGRSLAAARRHAKGEVRSRKTGRLVHRRVSRLRPTAVQRRGIAGRVARSQARAKSSAMRHERAIERRVMRNPSHRVPANAIAARELMLYGVNDSTTYRHAQAIIRNMAAKQVRGTYDPKLAVKAWLHWADGAAKNYTKEISRGKGYGIFTPADRYEAAKQAVDYYAEEIAEERSKLATKHKR